MYFTFSHLFIKMNGNCEAKIKNQTRGVCVCVLSNEIWNRKRVKEESRVLVSLSKCHIVDAWYAVRVLSVLMIDMSHDFQRQTTTPKRERRRTQNESKRERVRREGEKKTPECHDYERSIDRAHARILSLSSFHFIPLFFSKFFFCRCFSLSIFYKRNNALKIHYAKKQKLKMKMGKTIIE